MSENKPTLREQMEEILGDYKDSMTYLSEASGSIINLFKAEVVKLAVIDCPYEVNEKDDFYGYIELNDLYMFTEATNAQLQHTKKQLLDLMGE